MLSSVPMEVVYVLRFELFSPAHAGSVTCTLSPCLVCIAQKSSLVCAFALGLAGKPDLLGRAKKASEFIKIGCHTATIEIELCDKGTGANLVVKREISDTNVSKWHMNEEKCTYVVAKHLCMFHRNS